MKKRATGKPSDYHEPWKLVIEFNGLCAAELIRPPDCDMKPEMIIHFVNDAMHQPVLAVRDRDVRTTVDCRPDTKALVPSRTICDKHGHDKSEPATTLSLWSPLRGSHQQLPEKKRWALNVNTKKADMNGDQPNNPCSLRWLPLLGDILGSNTCDARHDFAQFRLTEGSVRSGRLNDKRQFRITAGGEVKREGPLAVTIVYELIVEKNSLVIDLHPGLLTVGPPDEIHEDKKLAHDGLYEVEMTYSSLPVSTLPAHKPLKRLSDDGSEKSPEHQSSQHFNEYNRLVGTDKLVEIVEMTPRRSTVEDPIHCFDASVLP